MALPSSTTEPNREPHELDNPVDAQADEPEQTPVAETETEDTSQTSDTENASPASADNDEDAEVKEWAAKKNLPLDDPLKIAKMYREAEKELGKKGQQEGQLKAAVTEANDVAGNDEVASLRNEVAALGFYIQHPEAKQFESTMVQILEEKPYLANDLETLLDAAKGRTSTEAQRLAAERKAGKAEALALAESAARAAPPKASATSTDFESGKITPQNVDALIGQHMGDTKWYADHKAEIDAALAS